MAYKPPVRTTLKEGKLSLRAEWIEGILRPPRSPLLDKPYEPKVVEIRGGRKMVVRMIKDDEINMVLEGLRKLINMQIDVDFFDLVAARTYAEILAYVRKRIKDEWIQIGILDTGEIAGVVNARLWNEKIAISLHTIVFKRGIGAGFPLYLAKMEYAFDQLGVEEWWPTFESYYGFRMGAIMLAAMQKPYPEYQHEAGGSRIFHSTKEQWFSYIKPSYQKELGTRPVPEDLLKITEKPKLPNLDEEFGIFLKK
ncbi:MAG TPA: hypothetical protein ENF75_04160 [Acidilobales archaeon]|nr:hypothetical protein [Acidilobales archaeon]